MSEDNIVGGLLAAIVIAAFIFFTGLANVSGEDQVELKLMAGCKLTGNYVFKDNKRLIKCEVK